MEDIRWLNPLDKEKIDRFCDMLVNQAPEIAEDVLTRGFGSFMTWFTPPRGRSLFEGWLVSQCGCLVGTTAVCIRERYPEYTTGLSEQHDGPVILFELLSRVLGNDLTAYPLRPDRVMTPDELTDSERAQLDPLFLLILDAGFAVSDEVEQWEDELPLEDERDDYQRARSRQISGYIKERIRTPLREATRDMFREAAVS